MSNLQDVQGTGECRRKGRMPKRYIDLAIYFLGER